MHFAQLVEPAPDDAHVVFHHAVALRAELVLQLCADTVEQRLLLETLLLHQRRGGEERAHERGTLHSIAELGIRRLAGRDLERVEDVHSQMLRDDLAPRRGGERLPERVGFQIALDHEHSAVGQPGKRIGVTEDVRVRGEHDVHVLQLAVEPNGLVRERRVERRGLPFFSEPYFGFALMYIPSSSKIVIDRFLPIVIAPQPPTEWMRTDDRALRHQIRRRLTSAARGRRGAGSSRAAGPARSGAWAASSPAEMKSIPR